MTVARFPQLAHWGAFTALVENGRLIATGEPGALVFGPYLQLPAGEYELRWLGRALGTGGKIGFSVTAESRTMSAAEEVTRRLAGIGNSPSSVDCTPGRLGKRLERMRQRRSGKQAGGWRFGATRRGWQFDAVGEQVA